MATRAITPRQIEAFKAILETGLVTAAAERMNLSQPAVSKLIANFEAAVGLALFRRVKKRLVPTPEADLVYREVDKLFTGLQDIANVAREIRGLRAGELSIACVAALGHDHVPRLVAQFLKDKPDVNVGLYITSADHVAEWVIAQKVDFGISMSALEHPAVVSEPLCSVEAVCVMPRDHRLARKRVVKPQDLAGETFVSFAPGSRIRHTIDGIFERSGVARRTTAHAFVSNSACALVANGFGVSIVEPFTAQEYARRGVLVARPFRPAVIYDFQMFFPRFRERSMLAREFAARLAQMVRTVRFDWRGAQSAEAPVRTITSR
jgi:DNA-binding transcriptional LysR family regulator